jgi:sulfopyruvate decarboxylase TPP-binding subunit
MNDIIIRPKNKKQSEELQAVLQDMKVKFFISDTEKEDQALLKAILDVKEETTKPIAELYNALGWK